MSSQIQTCQLIIPHLTVNDGEKAIAWYEKAFGAEVTFLARGDSEETSKHVVHASLRLDNGVQFDLADVCVVVHVWFANIAVTLEHS